MRAQERALAFSFMFAGERPWVLPHGVTAIADGRAGMPQEPAEVGFCPPSVSLHCTPLPWRSRPSETGAEGVVHSAPGPAASDCNESCRKTVTLIDCAT